MRTLQSRFDKSGKKNCKIKALKVADAVGCEPVSTSKFLANREINREFCKNGRQLLISTLSQRANSITSTPIPYAREQGIISAEQGILAHKQGILSG
jgi:hypothetical protein